MFSWPLTGVEGRAAAFAIAAEMMPWSGDCAEAASVLLLDQQASTNVTTFYLLLQNCHWEHNFSDSLAHHLAGRLTH